MVVVLVAHVVARVRWFIAAQRVAGVVPPHAV
jgi:hypothetical protein